MPSATNLINAYDDNLVAARSVIELEPGAVLQPFQRRMDTELNLSHLDGVGEVQQSLLPRGTSEHKEAVLSKRYSKRNFDTKTESDQSHEGNRTQHSLCRLARGCAPRGGLGLSSALCLSLPGFLSFGFSDSREYEVCNTSRRDSSKRLVRGRGSRAGRSCNLTLRACRVVPSPNASWPSADAFQSSNASRLRFRGGSYASRTRKCEHFVQSTAVFPNSMGQSCFADSA